MRYKLLSVSVESAYVVWAHGSILVTLREEEQEDVVYRCFCGHEIWVRYTYVGN